MVESEGQASQNGMYNDQDTPIAMLERPPLYDEKDDLQALKDKLQQKRKPIMIGLVFFVVVVIGACIGFSTGETEEASTESMRETVKPTLPPSKDFSKSLDNDKFQNAKLKDMSSSYNTTSSESSGSDSSGSEDSMKVVIQRDEEETEEPTEPPEPALPFLADKWEWKDISNWEYSGGKAPSSDMFSDDGIKLTSANSPEPIRSKKGWGGEKIVLIEWERSSSSDTNIWMLNTKLQSQFGVGNGWPYWGELDIFEMFTQDKITQSHFDFTGFGGFSDVASYGQLTFHMGPKKEDGDPCFCPASHSKGMWYQGQSPMTSGCTAQFANTPKNSIATVFGSDGNGQYIQLWQNPTVTKGGKFPEGDENGEDTYDITQGSGAVTAKIYNNANLFWGVPASNPCAKAGGHNPTTGFPFFEDFRLILEEQKKNDGGAWFKVSNIQIFKKH